MPRPLRPSPAHNMGYPVSTGNSAARANRFTKSERRQATRTKRQVRDCCRLVTISSLNRKRLPIFRVTSMVVSGPPNLPPCFPASYSQILHKTIMFCLGWLGSPYRKPDQSASSTPNVTEVTAFFHKFDLLKFDRPGAGLGVGNIYREDPYYSYDGSTSAALMYLRLSAFTTTALSSKLQFYITSWKQSVST